MSRQDHQKASNPGTLYCLPPQDYFYIRHNRERFARDLVAPIKALGYDETTAAHYARLIAENPCRDWEDKIVVLDCDAVELDHLDLDPFPKTVEGVIDGELCEHSNESLRELFKAIKALGFDDEIAGNYAAWIGDTPIKDKDGKVVVMDDSGKVVARLDLDFFD